MASKVTAQVIGGQAKTLDGVRTVRDVAQEIGLSGETRQVTVNGEPASYTTELKDYAFVYFTDAKKGGC